MDKVRLSSVIRPRWRCYLDLKIDVSGPGQPKSLAFSIEFAAEKGWDDSW